MLLHILQINYQCDLPIHSHRAEDTYLSMVDVAEARGDVVRVVRARRHVHRELVVVGGPRAPPRRPALAPRAPRHAPHAHQQRHPHRTRTDTGPLPDSTTHITGTCEQKSRLITTPTTKD